MIKLGCVPYLNALPLIARLDPQEFELINRPPAQLLHLLERDQVEAALLPIVDYFENQDLCLIPNIAIACRGPVRSVKLYLEGNIKQLKTSYLDPESRTSQALLKVILHHKYGVDLKMLCFTSDLSHPSLQAKLLIGDKTFDEQGPSLDLGEEWCVWQKKPFVFAAWMTKNSNNKTLATELTKAREEGLQKIDEIIQNLSPNAAFDPKKFEISDGGYRGEMGLSPRFEPKHPASPVRGGSRRGLREYFTKNVHYYMDAEELEGIRRFYELLKPIQGYSHELHFKFVS